MTNRSIIIDKEFIAEFYDHIVYLTANSNKMEDLINFWLHIKQFKEYSEYNVVHLRIIAEELDLPDDLEETMWFDCFESALYCETKYTVGKLFNKYYNHLSYKIMCSMEPIISLQEIRHYYFNE